VQKRLSALSKSLGDKPYLDWRMNVTAGNPRSEMFSLSHDHLAGDCRCPSSVHAFRADQECEPVDFEVAQQVASEHPEPLLLCLVGKLFTFLRALELKLPDVLQVVDHFVNEDRQVRRRVAGPTFRQIDRLRNVVVHRHGQTLAGQAGRYGPRLRLPSGKPLVAQLNNLALRNEF